MKDAELNRIRTASQAQPAPYSPLSLRARLISHRTPTKSQKAQALTHNGVRPHYRSVHNYFDVMPNTGSGRTIGSLNQNLP